MTEKVSSEEPFNLRTVLFDLDGTLLDTAPDMANALNELLCERGREPLKPRLARAHCSRGAAGLIRLAFGSDLPKADFARLCERFLELYTAELCNETCLFPGMAEVLTHIEGLGLQWGVVTNKAASLTDRLIDTLALTARASCVISGDTTDQKKPHPKPLLHACACCASEVGRCVYIGDDPRDVQAGRAAGMITLVARYGYIGEEQNPFTWGAHGVLDDIGELPAWLRRANLLAQAG